MGYFETAVSPLYAFLASDMQQMLPRMTTAGIQYANGLTQVILRIVLVLCYLRPNEEERQIERIACDTDFRFLHEGIQKSCTRKFNYGIALRTKNDCKFHTIG